MTDAANDRLQELVSDLTNMGIESPEVKKKGLAQAVKDHGDVSDAILKAIQDLQAEAPKIVAALEAVTTSANKSVGDDDDADDESSDSEDWPTVGPGVSDNISVVSDLTTPTVMLDSVVNEEEKYEELQIPTEIGGNDTGQPMLAKPPKRKSLVNAVKSNNSNALQRRNSTTSKSTTRQASSRQLNSSKTSKPIQATKSINSKASNKNASAATTATTSTTTSNNTKRSKSPLPSTTAEPLPSSPTWTTFKTGGAAAKRRTTYSQRMARLGSDNDLPERPLPVAQKPFKRKKKRKEPRFSFKDLARDNAYSTFWDPDGLSTNAFEEAMFQDTPDSMLMLSPTLTPGSGAPLKGIDHMGLVASFEEDDFVSFNAEKNPFAAPSSEADPFVASPQKIEKKMAVPTEKKVDREKKAPSERRPSRGPSSPRKTPKTKKKKKIGNPTESPRRRATRKASM